MKHLPALLYLIFGCYFYNVTVGHSQKNKHYIIAPNGLTLRKEASSLSGKITVIPYGTAITVVEMPKWIGTFALPCLVVCCVY
ncbi:hypothetical protein [Abyssalbus ytuae]|uniref:Uncharacterized protein n=1 Tax=Abyssalbus ytuae TaxID=2926907 RepID=A0A9E7A0R4_9FLAO|nr:hypothetical protein [Abyssalbus ytuae]UOB18817.1 hypothetical protein MQE35_05860 [Abyssalbus ytuae]